MKKNLEKNLKTILENIKRERKKYGYTQEDIANILNMSLSAYRKLEQGQRKLSLEHIISISNFLNVDLPTLFRMQTNEADILNQNEKKRKEFLRELLETFGIGTPPQKPYTDKDITSLLTFIRAYGHSVPYCPSRVKNQIIYTGKYSEIFREVDRLGNIFYNQFPEMQQKVSDLEEKEKNLIEHCRYLTNYLAQLQQIELAKLYPEAEKIKESILQSEQKLEELNDEIRKKKEHLSNLKEEESEVDGNIEWLKRVLARIEKETHEVAQQLGGSSSRARQIVEYEKDYVLLEEKYNLIFELYNQTSDDFNALNNQFEEKVESEVLKIEEKMKVKLKKIIQDKIDDTIETYHNIDAETLDDIIYNLILFAQGFETLAGKYKTASKNIIEYVKDPSSLLDNIDYSKLYDIEYISQYAKDNIEWERKYRADIPIENSIEIKVAEGKYQILFPR